MKPLWPKLFVYSEAVTAPVWKEPKGHYGEKEAVSSCAQMSVRTHGHENNETKISLLKHVMDTSVAEIKNCCISR